MVFLNNHCVSSEYAFEREYSISERKLAVAFRGLSFFMVGKKNARLNGRFSENALVFLLGKPV